MGDLRSFEPESGPSQGLTRIPQRIHCAATPDAAEGQYSETDQIIIDNFLNSLAEIALAVASRRSSTHDEQA